MAPTNRTKQLPPKISFYIEAQTESQDRFILARNLDSIHHATNMCLEIISNRFFTVISCQIRDSIDHELVEEFLK